MRAKANNELKPKNFWDNYCENIAPRLMEIDLMLKSAEPPYDILEIADILETSTEEITEILDSFDIKNIDQAAFFLIMKKSNGKICELYRREIAMGSPQIYSTEKISYIYQIKPSDINNALKSLGIKEITAFTMPLLFSKIPV